MSDPIESISIWKVDVPFHQPVRVAIGILSAAQNVIVRIRTRSGVDGWGEASPLPCITGDSQHSNFITAQALAEVVKGKDALATEARLAEIGQYTVGEPSVRSAFDMALFDILGKTAGLPLYRLFGGEKRNLRTNRTIGIEPTVNDTLAITERYISDGHESIKIKTGRPGRADVEHVSAVRELAGRDISIKIDSNQGWDYPRAVENLRAMRRLELQFAEQPLPYWNIDAMRQLRCSVDIPICADESVFTDKDAMRILRSDAADYLNIKLGKSGGISTGLKICAIAESAGAKCMVGCFGESRLGLSAAVHLALARSTIKFVDLDSALHLREDPVIGGMSYDGETNGTIHIAEEPGLGAVFDECFLNRSEGVLVQ